MLSVVLLSCVFAVSISRSAIEAQDTSVLNRQLAAYCLQLCSCVKYHHGKTTSIRVSCEGLSTFPLMLPPGISDLILNDNALGRITAHDLTGKGLDKIKTFECSGCKLKEVTGLHELKRLKYVDLSRNMLGNMIPEMFSSLKRLKMLNLTENFGLDCVRFKDELVNVEIECDHYSVSIESVITGIPESSSENSNQNATKSVSTEEPIGSGTSPMWHAAQLVITAFTSLILWIVLLYASG
jgi:Leucine rich repeat